MAEAVLRIRELREARGLNMSQLSRLIGSSSSCIAEWERGGKSPLSLWLPRLAAALDCSILDLYRTEDLLDACEEVAANRAAEAKQGGEKHAKNKIR